MKLTGSRRSADAQPRIVAVVSSASDLQRAVRLRRTPDFFELRLDALVPCLDLVERTIDELRAPLIITARDRAEGGLAKLAPERRAALLLRFLPHASLIDVELCSIAQMQSVLARAQDRKVQLIVSVHELRATPSVDRMQQLARHAESHGAQIFKVATRTDTAAELARLIQLVDEWRSPMRLSVMGIGKLGRASRIALLRKGSALNYAHLSDSWVEGQLSIPELRRAWLVVRRAHSP